MALTPADSRRLLLLFVATAALLGTALSSQQSFPVCDVKCCTVLPSCRAALRVMCNCNGQESMVLRKGDIPKSVLAIDIWNAKNVVIDKDAVNDLKHLTNFSLRGIDEVEIRANGMAFDEQSKIRSVKFQDIRRLRIRSKAFSGVWKTRTSISISRTTELHMEPNAFEYRSTSLGPSLALRHVGMLHLDSNGFTAPLYYLSLDDVTMNACRSESFSGKMHTIKFNRVTIEEANVRCFSNLGSLSTFAIQSSRIKTMYPQAFSGNIRELIIKNCNFTFMQERSIDIRTVIMQITSSLIKHLSANGLSVMAKDSIRLEHIRVDFLRKNALAGLQIQRSSDGLTQPLDIRELEIMNAEDGSLAFSDCTEIRMTGLYVKALWPRVCPTEKWARKLVGATASGQLKPAQFQVFSQLFDRHLCSEDDRIPFRTMTSEQSPPCAMPSRNTNDFFVYDDYADASSPGSPTESAASSVPDQTKPPGDVDGGSPGGAEQSTVGYVVHDQGEMMATSNSGDVTTDNSYRPEMEDTVNAVPSDAFVGSTETPPGSSSGPTAPRAETESQQPAEPVPSQRPTAGYGHYALPAPAPAGTTSSDPEQRLLLYLTLGAVFSMTVVLVVVVVLLLLLVRRRSCGRQLADDQPPAMEKPAAVLTDRQLTSGGVDKRQSTTSGGSALPSVDYHQYEPVREDLLLPDTYHQYEPVRSDLLLPDAYHKYEPVRKSLPDAPPPTQYENSCDRSQVYASLLDR